MPETHTLSRTTLSEDATISRLERALIRERKHCTEQREEIARIAKTLRDFYNAPITIASIQPVLELAIALNPDLQVRRVAL